MPIFTEKIAYNIIHAFKTKQLIYDSGLEYPTTTFHLEEMDKKGYIKIPKSLQYSKDGRIPTGEITITPKGEKFYHDYKL